MKTELTKQEKIEISTSAFYDKGLFVEEANPFNNKEFDGVYTPFDLTLKMLGNTKVANKKVLVMYKIEIALALIYNTELEGSDITLFTTNELRNKVADKKGITVVSELEECMNKFDVIIMNPPYAGTSRLHQKFFNFAVDAVKTRGKVISLQPATPYFNNKSVNDKTVYDMLTNLKKYRTEVEFISDDIFENAAIATGLAITTLTKIKSDENISLVMYANGDTYKDVPLENISITEIDPDVVASIWNKYVIAINKFGSWQDNISTFKDNFKNARLQENRGHVGTDDFYTLISKDSKYYTADGTFGVRVKNKTQRENFFVYAKSNVARFGLALLKFNLSLNRGELAMIPMVDLDYQYEEEYLYELLGLTKKEIKVIEDFLPNYYG
jgi:hypothetical protein